MKIEIREDIRDLIIEHCDEWGLDLRNFLDNDIAIIFQNYQFMFDNPTNRELFYDHIKKYIEFESKPVKRHKRLKELGI